MKKFTKSFKTFGEVYAYLNKAETKVDKQSRKEKYLRRANRSK